MQVRLLFTSLVGALAIAIPLGAGPQAKDQPAKSKAEHARITLPDQAQWGPVPDALPPGAQLAVVEGDPFKPGAYTMRLKAPDGYRIPPHTHPKMEHVTVISGTMRVGMGDKWDDATLKELPTGTFAAIQPGTRHYAAAKGETIIQLHGTGPWSINYVDPKDDPRKKK
jgi:quercetin dioxygenase-like cupin family protein